MSVVPVLIFSIDTSILTCYVGNMFVHKKKSSKSASVASQIALKWQLARDCYLYHLVGLKCSSTSFKH